jgi:hypothetical protein
MSEEPADTAARPLTDGSPRLRLREADIRSFDVQIDATSGVDNPAAWLKPGAISPGGVAVAAVDGFLFIGDGANRWEAQYAMDKPAGEAWLSAWTGVLAKRQAEAVARGATLWNLVIPEKQVIYPEKRWPAGGPSGHMRPIRQLLPQLEPEARLLYPEEALVACKTEAPAYLRRNSHWTPSGCLTVLRSVLVEVAPDLDVAALDLAARHHHAPHDLTSHFFDPAPAEAMLLLEPPGERPFDNRMYERTGRHTGSIYGLHNSAAPDARKVLIFGDSYAYDAGLALALSAAFQEVTFVWSKAVDWARVADQAADVVICESAERFITVPPEA